MVEGTASAHAVSLKVMSVAGLLAVEALVISGPFFGVWRAHICVDALTVLIERDRADGYNCGQCGGDVAPINLGDTGESLG